MGIMKKLLLDKDYMSKQRKPALKTLDGTAKMPYVHQLTVKQKVWKVLRDLQKRKKIIVLPVLDPDDKKYAGCANPFNRIFKKRNQRVKVIWFTKENAFKSQNSQAFCINYSVLFKTSHKQIKELGKLITDKLSLEGVQCKCSDFLSGRIHITL